MTTLDGGTVLTTGAVSGAGRLLALDIALRLLGITASTDRFVGGEGR